MKNKMKHNWGLKLIAVLFAAVLWMISVDINDPVGTRNYSGLKVQIVNANSITSQGKVYKVLNNSDTVTVKVTAKQSVLSQITEDDFTLVADMSMLGEDNTIPIELDVTSSVENRAETITMNKESVSLSIEATRKKQLRIEVIENGELPEGYVTGNVTTETNTMSVIGPESAVEPVARAVVEINLDNATANINMVSNIRLLDAEGKEINNSELEKSIESVTVNVPVLPTKEVPVVFEISGTPAEGYVATGNMTVSKSSVVIAAKESVLNKIEEIKVPASELNVDEATADLLKNIDVEKYFPSDAALADKSDSGYISVTVEVLPIRHRVVSFSGSDVQLLNNPDSQRWLIEAVPDQTLRLRMAGLQQNLEGVDLSVVVPHADLSVLQDVEGNMPVGEVEIDVLFLIPDDVTQEENVKVKLRITEIAVTE